MSDLSYSSCMHLLAMKEKKRERETGKIRAQSEKFDASSGYNMQRSVIVTKVPFTVVIPSLSRDREGEREYYFYFSLSHS